MIELIKIDTREGVQVVSARELYEFLGLEERFSKWFDRFSDYGFIESKDYTPYQMVHPQNKQIITDYAITINMAKELSMLQRTDKGKQARQYFIECEKKLKEVSFQVPTTFAQALMLAAIQAEQLELKEAEIKKQEELIISQTPKVEYYDTVLTSSDGLTTTQIAKDYGMSAAELNRYLALKKIQYKQNDQWVLYADYQDKKYTHSETLVLSSGRTKVFTKWTQKGREFIHQLLIERAKNKLNE